MSGRTRHWRDGELVTNRKTDRRQTKRPLIERLVRLNDQCRKRYPTRWCPDVRLGFLLPKHIAPFVASGGHGIGVNVHRGFVQVTNGSFEECCVSAAHFFEVVAREQDAFTVLATVSSSSQEGNAYGRYLSVVNGAMVVSAGLASPRIYEAPHGA